MPIKPLSHPSLFGCKRTREHENKRTIKQYIYLYISIHISILALLLFCSVVLLFFLVCHLTSCLISYLNLISFRPFYKPILSYNEGMFPLYDETPRRSFPLVNYALIAANVVVFYLQLTAPDFEQFVYRFAFISSEFNPFILESYYYIITSMFMHGGFFHIISNMLFLHIFGDNIEDTFGHLRYLLFYLAAGVVATLSQYFLDTTSTIPMIGASGAVSGVAGAYFVFFRDSKVKTLVPIFGFFSLIDLSAGVVLGYWFISQVFSGLGALVIVQHGGVAFFAHIGGFIFGYLVAKTFKR